MEKVTLKIQTAPSISRLAEIEAERHGMDLSTFINTAVMDKVMRFENIRMIDTIADFLTHSGRFITQGMEEEEAKAISQKIAHLQRNYAKERLSPLMVVQNTLTDTAIETYLNGYSNKVFEGTDAFVITQCVQSIYDKLYQHELISEEEWKAQTEYYEHYMSEGEGNQLLK